MLDEKQLKYCQDLAEKMDYEGGLAEFLFHYTDYEAFKGLPFYDEAKIAYKSFHNLRKKMTKEGFPWL